MWEFTGGIRCEFTDLPSVCSDELPVNAAPRGDTDHLVFASEPVKVDVAMCNVVQLVSVPGCDGPVIAAPKNKVVAVVLVFTIKQRQPDCQLGDNAQEGGCSGQKRIWCPDGARAAQRVAWSEQSDVKECGLSGYN